MFAKTNMEFDYIDIHSHLYFPDFDADREEEIAKLKQNKIATITVGTDLQSSKKAIELSQKHDNLFATVGQHPGDVTNDTVFDERLETLFPSIPPERNEGSKEKAKATIVAIGECGLDYYRIPPQRSGGNGEKALATIAIQKKIFQRHIDLAIEKDLPLMLHVRPQKGTQDAYEDALEILESQAKTFGSKLHGNVHFFVGDLDILKRFLDIGFTVSFTGVVTFARDYDALVRYVPLDMVMSETDAPFVAPMPYRGKRNSPLYVPEVVKKIAEIRKENFEVVKIALRDNALRYFPSIAP